MVRVLLFVAAILLFAACWYAVKPACHRGSVESLFTDCTAR